MAPKMITTSIPTRGCPVLSDSDRQEAAESLTRAEHDRAPVSPLSERWPEMTVTDAYEIQLENIRRRCEAGETVRGQKVGLTAKVMQEMLGVDEPDYGHLLDSMFIADGGEVSAADFASRASRSKSRSSSGRHSPVRIARSTMCSPRLSGSCRR